MTVFDEILFDFAHALPTFLRLEEAFDSETLYVRWFMSRFTAVGSIKIEFSSLSDRRSTTHRTLLLSESLFDIYLAILLIVKIHYLDDLAAVLYCGSELLSS